MSKHLPSVCAWNHYKSSGFRHRQGKTFVGPRSQKREFYWRKSRASPKHTETSRKFHVFPAIMCRVSETPIFIVFSGLHEARSSKNALFWKTLKTRDREEDAFFERFGALSAGREIPVFVVFSRPPEDRVQLSSFEPPKIGFNYAPVSIYIYMFGGGRDIDIDNWSPFVLLPMCFGVCVCVSRIVFARTALEGRTLCSLRHSITTIVNRNR